MVNATVREFILLGFYEIPEAQLVLFVTFMIIYAATIVSNLLTLAVIYLDPHLHSPMYILLCNMSVIDLSFSTMVLPKFLDICLTGHNVITYTGCIVQVFFFVVLMVAEYFILAAMAYDRYVAICVPLRYANLMSIRVCVAMASTSWSIGAMEGVLFVVLISFCTFCKSNEINHLFCDLKPLIKLSCSDTKTIETTILGIGSFIGFLPSMFTLVSYTCIILTILNIPSRKGRTKTFSTCSSHLTVIVIFYGTVLGMYMRPKSKYSMDQDKVLAVLYAAVIPMVNPLIYSLRNTEVKSAVRKIGDRYIRNM
ncbi:olfactory receptor 1020-like [Spea bombifrons]|uniref:olfactory receptor 1020-like n=1 Tax=Spea bombifrons TaxID=233779 RepID=UPI002349BD46|nr:olfactory receptor 1020-like [Spea bombifrons]